jgi:CyaY protein
MTHSNYTTRVDTLFTEIEDAIDAANLSIETESESGMLSLIFSDDSQAIFSRQPSLGELWFAANNQGYHFKWENDRWIDTREGDDLNHVLNTVLTNKLGHTINLTLT